MGQKYGVDFLYRDFRPLFQAGQAFAREHGDDVLHLGKVVLIELLGSLGGALYRVFACHVAHPFGG